MHWDGDFGLWFCDVLENEKRLFAWLREWEENSFWVEIVRKIKFIRFKFLFNFFKFKKYFLLCSKKNFQSQKNFFVNKIATKHVK